MLKQSYFRVTSLGSVERRIGERGQWVPLFTSSAVRLVQSDNHVLFQILRLGTWVTAGSLGIGSIRGLSEFNWLG